MNTATSNNKTDCITIIYCLVLAVLAGAARFVLPPNFAMVGALAILVGARLRHRFAYMLPFVVLIVTDSLLYLTKYDRPFDPTVYLCLAIYVLIGRVVCSERSLWRPGVGALLGTAQFYLVTNLYSWWLLSAPGENYYERSLAGVLDSYIRAIKFARPTLISDLGFTLAFFILLDVVLHYATRRATENQASASTVDG